MSGSLAALSVTEYLIADRTLRQAIAVLFLESVEPASPWLRNDGPSMAEGRRPRACGCRCHAGIQHKGTPRSKRGVADPDYRQNVDGDVDAIIELSIPKIFFFLKKKKKKKKKI